MIAKYEPAGLWDCLLANANVGGGNTHRGSTLGAVLGVRSTSSDIGPKFQAGLYHQGERQQDIDAFCSSYIEL